MMPPTGLTARAIPVVGAGTGVLVTRAVGWTTLPVVPNMTCPGADVTPGIDADDTLARAVFIGLILLEEAEVLGGVCGGKI